MSRLINLNEGKYTIVPDNIIRDKDLDLKSRGMLVTLLNLAEKARWDWSEMGLKKLFNGEGRASIRTALKKLEQLGYLKRTQRTTARGFFGVIDYYVSTERLDTNTFLDKVKEREERIENEPPIETPTSAIQKGFFNDTPIQLLDFRTTVNESDKNTVVRKSDNGEKQPLFGFPTSDKPTSENHTQYEIRSKE
jgi:hypothetical protein